MQFIIKTKKSMHFNISLPLLRGLQIFLDCFKIFACSKEIKFGINSLKNWKGRRINLDIQDIVKWRNRGLVL